MSEAARLSGLIGMIYDAVLDTERWPGMLRGVADAIGAESGGVVRQDTRTHETIFFQVGMSEAFLDEFPSYADRNVLFRRSLALETGSVFTDTDLIPRADLSSTDYGGFLRRHEIGSVLASILLRDDHSVTGITMNRRPDKAAFGPAEVEGLSRIAPHLQRALALLARIGRLQMQSDGAGGALEHLAHGVMLLDGELKVVFANRAASAMLRARDGLWSRGDRLATALGEQNADFQRVLRQALGGRSGALAVARPSERLALQVAVLPLTVQIPWLPGTAPRVVLFVIDVDRAGLLPEIYLRELYGLTRAETNIATLILAGRTRKQAAAELGVSDLTAKTHLERIFAKTGATRQSELLRLLAGLTQIRL